MDATGKKIFEVALSILLVALICIPIPASRAFAEEDEGISSTTAQPQDAQGEEGEKSVNTNDIDMGESATSDEVSTEVTDPRALDISEEASDSPDGTDIVSVIAPNAATARARALVATTSVPSASASALQNESGAAPSASSMADAFKASGNDIVSVANAAELIYALESVNTLLPSGKAYTIRLAADIELSESVSIASGKEAILDGGGNAISLTGTASIGVNGTLHLVGPLVIEEARSHVSSMIKVTGGTLEMGDAVEIAGNDEAGTFEGGAIYLSDKATFDMLGGSISGCQAVRGGAVFISDARPSTASRFEMSGNATISGNRATEVGGGVYVGTRDVLSMEENASVTDNSADAAGGVMNYGSATLDAVYNNTTRNGAADIFNFKNAMLLLSPANPDWMLTRTGTHVTGWYIDNYHITDDDGNQGEGMHRWDPALDDNVEYVPSSGATREELHLIAGAPLPVRHVDVLWENQDGSVLYEMDGVAEGDVPEASEYGALSGNSEPSEPDTADGYKHEFIGWLKTHPADDEIVYIANYRLVATQAASSHDLFVRYVDETGDELAPTYNARYVEGEHYIAPVPAIEGYEPDRDTVDGTMEGADVYETVTYHKADEQPKANDGDGDERDGGANGNDSADDETTGDADTSSTRNETNDSGFVKTGSLQDTGDSMGGVLVSLMVTALVSGGALAVICVRKKKEEK